MIKSLTGWKCSYPYDYIDTVADLKCRIQDVEGIPPDQARLIFEGRQLSDERTLYSYRIRPGETVHLVLRLRGFRHFEDYKDSPGRSILSGSFDYHNRDSECERLFPESYVVQVIDGIKTRDCVEGKLSRFKLRVNTGDIGINLIYYSHKTICKIVTLFSN